MWAPHGTWGSSDTYSIIGPIARAQLVRFLKQTAADSSIKSDSSGLHDLKLFAPKVRNRFCDNYRDFTRFECSSEHERPTSMNNLP